MIVRLTASAEADLEAIGDMIARDNPRRAVTFLFELREKCLGLAALPRSYPLVPRYEAQGVRRRVHGNYLIFYRIVRTDIVVFHVLHGARDYEALLLPN